MVVLNKKAFRLPRVERDKFILLMRLGLEYKRDEGVFCVKSYNNIERLRDVIANILNVEEVAFSQSCAICGKDFPCTGCRYFEPCATKNLPLECVCSECLREASFEKKSA